MNASDSNKSVREYLAGPIDRTARKNLDRLIHADDVVKAVVLPDIHAAGNVCVGVALATRKLLYPMAGGADIGCGMLAVPIKNTVTLRRNDRRLFDAITAIRESVPIHRQRTAQFKAMSVSLTNTRLSCFVLEHAKRKCAVAQFGTLGRGNHFVELLRSEQGGEHWIVIHTGSRGIGQQIADHHSAIAAVGSNGLGALLATSEEGENYLADAHWACRYASANRHAIASAFFDAISQSLGGRLDWDAAIETPHDFIRRERHEGDELWVHRKGVQPLQNNEAGILPTSMGNPTLIIRGRDTANSLQSVSHGCGRLLSRGEAIETVSIKHVRNALAQIVTSFKVDARLKAEAPAAFRRLRDVTQAQRALFRTVDRLTPLLCHKSIG